MAEQPPPNSIQPESRAAWRDWLREHHAGEQGVWLVLNKKASSQPGIEYDAAVEEALCFGWIDGKAQTLDDERWRVWMAPRKRGSGWAASNKARIERLTAAGLMEPAGLAVIETARRDGSWHLLDSVEALEVPPDLAEALAAYPDAARHFEAFSVSARRGILYWIATAKRPETRAKRVAESARLAQDNLPAPQSRRA